MAIGEMGAAVRGQTQAAGRTQYTVTEMIPDLGQLWLTDREGRRYSSGLRPLRPPQQRVLL